MSYRDAPWRVAVSGALAVMVGAAAGLSIVLARPSAPAGAVAPAVCGVTAPDEKAAAAMAARCAVKVEALAERTETSQLFVQPSGARKLVTSTSPQRVRRTDGSWTAIAEQLVRQADGSLKPAATLADVSFSGGGDGPLVTWREAGQTFTLSWPLGKLPAPRVNGSTAVYESVLPGVNLHLVATAQGYRHAIEVLTSAAAANPAVRQLRYTTGGDLQVKANADGGLRLVDSRGRAVATSVPSRMWDSSTDAAYAGEVLPEVAAAWAAGAARPVVAPATAAEAAATSRTAPVAVSVGAGEIRVAADAAFLADPRVTYPVFIDPPFEKQRSKWAYATSNGESNNNANARVGNNPETAGTYRSFYDFDISGLKGKKVLGATVRITLDHSFSCTPTWVHLYRTSAITVSSAGRMAWTTRPLPSSVHLDAWEGNANEAGGCGSIQPDTDAEFTSGSLTSDLQAAANGSSNGYTVGLCACNEEGGYETTEDRWKRFYTDKAWIEVTYDSVPGTPTNLTTSGQECGTTIGTSSPVFKAYYTDADAAADSLTGYFEYQQTAPTVGTVIAKTGQTKPGNAYGDSGTITLGSGADGATYQWRVKTKDAAGYESNPVWSPWCTFTVSLSAPPLPGVSSAQYPEDGVSHGGPGEPGTFVFTAGASDVKYYYYRWAGSSTTSMVWLTTPGANHTVDLAPPRHGLNTLEVYTKNSAGKTSPIRYYRFLVDTPAAPAAHWPLDTIDAHGFNDQIGNAHLAAGGNVSMAYDARIPGEAVASFDGASELKASVPVIDPAKSFSVSAWVKLGEPGDPLPTTGHAAVVQDGDRVDSFVLGYTGGTEKKWGFWLHGRDENDPGVVGKAVPEYSTATTGRWTHLTGVYDAGARKTSLYVNGVLARTASLGTTTSWTTARAVAVGRQLWNQSTNQHWRGQIADVRLWQRVVVPDDLTGTMADPTQGMQATAGILRPTELASWDFSGGYDSVCASAISASYWSQMLDLTGCTDPYSPEQTAGFTGDSHDDNDSLWLNSTQPDGHGSAGTGHAATTGPVVRTDQSFTVSAWVRLSALPTADSTVLAQDGTNVSGFYLGTRSVGGEHFWSLAMKDRDDDAATTRYVTSTAALTTADVGEWVHLVGVYDNSLRELRLYVDGQVPGTSASAPITPWHAAGQLTVGRARHAAAPGDFFSGSVDQVKVFAGVMPDHEIKALHDNS